MRGCDGHSPDAHLGYLGRDLSPPAADKLASPVVDLSPLAGSRPHVVIHARAHPLAVALCGAEPGTPWTDRRGYVACPPCEAEIERRLRARGALPRRADKEPESCTRLPKRPR